MRKVLHPAAAGPAGVSVTSPPRVRTPKPRLPIRAVPPPARGCGRGVAEATVPRALRRKEGSACAEAPPSEREARSDAAVAATAMASTTGVLPNGSARTSPIPSEVEPGRSFERADITLPRARALVWNSNG